MSEPTVIRVGGDGRDGYDVLVGEHLSGLPELLGNGVRRVGVVVPESLQDRGQALRRTLDDAGFETHALVIPDGERAKDAAVLGFCWGVLGEAGFTRSDALVTLGGGSTTDLGGFVAASWLRGIAVVHVPTTLLAMVDAAVGGKTGINTAAGKNLVGAFHEPAGVLCDLATLATLPHAELVSGLAEVIKCGFIADPAILELVETAPPAGLVVGAPALRELVERAVRVKAEVVSADLKETGGSAGHPGREALNYGHTLGHAIEKCEHYAVRHGEAISVGMVFVAAELARRAGRLDDETADRHARLLGSVGLPTAYDGVAWADLHAAMRIDKKSRGNLLRFVVLDGLARPAILEGPTDEELLEAYAALRGSASDAG